MVQPQIDVVVDLFSRSLLIINYFEHKVVLITSCFLLFPVIIPQTVITYR